jgi:hypothetical protein
MGTDGAVPSTKVPCWFPGVELCSHEGSRMGDTEGLPIGSACRPVHL